MKAFILRHGETEYKQGNTPVSLEEADDIKEEAKPVLRQSTREIYSRSGKKLIQIISSPYGRALASAKEVYSELQTIDAKTTDIIINSELREVDGLDYNLFIGLVEGKPIEVNGSVHNLERKITNPNNLSPITFFRNETIHKPEYQKTLPADLVLRLKEIETYKSIESRLNNVMRKLDKESILVTHEGGTGNFVITYRNDIEAFLDRGKFIELERNNNLFLPTYMNQYK